ncbi:MAG: DUF1552 domain-containing protein [Verrucomicrobiota bacterium]
MKPQIDRRTFLRASGVSLALPMLESMGAAAEKPPKRMVFICNTLGFYPPAFFPKTVGRDYESTPYLDLLAEHRDDFTVFSGLSHPDQGGEHLCEVSWLSGARNPGKDGFRNSISVDQFAAEKLGSVTRYPSISLSSDGPKSQSYTANGVMIPAQDRPSRVFTKLFLQGNADEIARQKLELSDGRSILDSIGSERTRILRNASPADRERLEAYFESIRQTERELTEAEAWFERPKPQVSAPPPEDIADKRDLIGRIQQLLKLVTLILETDSSRILSVVIQNNHGMPQIPGVEAEHHNLSHHGKDPSKIEQLQKIEASIMRSFGKFLSDLNSRPESGGALLDSASILLGSNLGNAAAHDPRNNPIILAGGRKASAGHVAFDSKENTPLSNLFLSMLQSMDFEVSAFASSSGWL